jgi:hypothetical protein
MQGGMGGLKYTSLMTFCAFSHFYATAQKGEANAVANQSS